MIALNPFHNPRSGYSRTHFAYHGAPLFSHRGVDVYRASAGSWDYVLKGVTITQRAGFNKDRARKLIDDMLDGIEPRSTRVADHITACGHKGYTYEQYMADWQAGKVA